MKGRNCVTLLSLYLIDTDVPQVLDIAVRVLSLLGGLGIFLYGMKLMSESLQKVAGNRLRKILSMMTRNKYTGFLAGLLVTGLVQSSSATTVMVVSFVNAGLLTLSGSIAVILGANLGTTVTAWLVSLLGFKFSIAAVSLPLIGLSLPFLFARRGLRRNWGEVILGFALLFLGLQFMKEVFPGMREKAEFYQFLASFTDLGWVSVLLFVFLGMLITIVIQSSSATMALTLVLAYNNLVPFDLAAAMVLGENLGTTITANLAATVANITAKQTARAHFLINLIGVIWMLIVFKPFLKLLDSVFIFLVDDPIFSAAPATTPDGLAMLPIGLAAFHSAFNLINVSILIFLIPQLKKISGRMVRLRTGNIEYHIRSLDAGIVSVSELSMLEARQSIAQLGLIITRMFSDVTALFMEKEDRRFAKINRRISKHEDLIDAFRSRINEFLTNLSADDLSVPASRKVSAMRFISDNLENIGDRCFELSRIISQKQEKKVWFHQEQREGILALFHLVTESLRIMNANLSLDYDSVKPEAALDAEKKVDEQRNALVEAYLQEISQGTHRADAGNYFRDLYSIAERIGDHVINITEVMLSSQQKNKRAKN